MQAELAATRAAADKLHEEFAFLRAEAETAQKQADEARAEKESAQAALEQAHSDAEAAKTEVEAVCRASRPRSEFAELEQKFNLALADVQKLKRENSGLRDELAYRPEANAAESPELIAVRSERDALAAKVAELLAAAAAAHAEGGDRPEARGPAAAVRNGGGRRAAAQAARMPSSARSLPPAARTRSRPPAPAAATGPPSGRGSWPCWKRKMLPVRLGPIAPPSGPRSPRRSMQPTAPSHGKMRRSPSFEQRSAPQAQSTPWMKKGPRPAKQLFDADEVIAAERKRLAELTAEMEGKLRAAELEISVERGQAGARAGCLARKTVRAAKRLQPLGQAEPLDPNKPRRRWLSALGLHDEDEGKKK